MKTLKFFKALAYSIGRYVWRSITVKRYKKHCWICDADFKTTDRYEMACKNCR